VTAPDRISKRFAEIRAAGELGIVAYITEGDPIPRPPHPPSSNL